MLVILREHPTMKDNPQRLAKELSVSEATIRRWLDESERAYRARTPSEDSD
jgi:DeoR/GlpR family transcriptional regulator of sugar metabolism